MRQGKIIAREVKGHCYRVLVHYDLYGKRRQKSLGRISEADVRMLLQGGQPRTIGKERSDETPREGEEEPEEHSAVHDGANGDQADPELAELLEVYQRAMRDISRVFSSLYPWYPEHAERFHEVVRAIRAGGAVMIGLFPDVHGEGQWSGGRGDRWGKGMET